MRKPLITAVPGTLAAVAAVGDAWADASRPRTHAEVLAEFEQARRDGTMYRGGEASDMLPQPVRSSRTRAEVRAEVERARADGTLWLGGEIHPDNGHSPAALARRASRTAAAALNRRPTGAA